MDQHGDRSSVLLVEDDVLVRLSVADDLRQAGLTVLEAANADEARIILESQPGWVGVVVTDIQMPGSMNGRGLVRLVRAHYPEIRVVILSGAAPGMLADLNADAVFVKPHYPDRLVALLRQLLGDKAGSNGSENSNAGRR